MEKRNKLVNQKKKNKNNKNKINNFGNSVNTYNIKENSEKWYYINDSKIITVVKEDVLQMRPYLLFYKRTNNK